MSMALYARCQYITAGSWELSNKIQGFGICRLDAKRHKMQVVGVTRRSRNELLADPRLGWLTEAEIARFVITEATDESERCFNQVVQQIVLYRLIGERALPDDFPQQYPSSKKPYVTSREQTLSRLHDNANTFVNYLEYTQLIVRGAGKT